MNIVGNIGTITQGALTAYLQLVPQTIPTVKDSTVVAPQYYTIISNPDGSFELSNIVFGTYDVVVDNRKLFQIGVEDSDITATIDAIISSSVSFSAETSTQGWIVATDVANLRLVPWKTTHKFARLTAPQAREPREWVWDAGSVAEDDGLTVVMPYNITITEPGRWLVW